MNTLDDIASNSKIFKESNGERPLPIEKNNNPFFIKFIPQYYKQFKILDESYQNQTYFDNFHKYELPKFATINIENSDGILSHKDTCKGKLENHIRSSNCKNNWGLLTCLEKISEAEHHKKFSYLRGMKFGSILFPFLFIFSLCSFFALMAYCEKINPFGLSINSFIIGSFIFSCIVSLLYSIFNYFISTKYLTVEASFDFKGQIPDKVRKFYYENKDKFDEMYLVCDAQNKWGLKITSQIIYPKIQLDTDPLLIGIKKLEGKEFIFLLDKFDVTFDENYLTKEFITN